MGYQRHLAGVGFRARADQRHDDLRLLGQRGPGDSAGLFDRWINLDQRASRRVAHGGDRKHTGGQRCPHQRQFGDGSGNGRDRRGRHRRQGLRLLERWSCRPEQQDKPSQPGAGDIDVLVLQAQPGGRQLRQPVRASGQQRRTSPSQHRRAGPRHPFWRLPGRVGPPGQRRLAFSRLHL